MVASTDPWLVYMLECANGRIYTGITNNLEKRFLTHKAGKGAMYTRLNRPLSILATYPCKNRSDASKLEHKTKKLTPSQKRALALQWSSGNEDQV